MLELMDSYQRRRQRELGQMGAVVSFAVNDPKKLADRIKKIAPAPKPDKPEPEKKPHLTEYGEEMSGPFVKRWWENTSDAA